MFPRRFTSRLTFASAVLLAGTSSACNDRSLISAPASLSADRLERHDASFFIPVANVAIVRRIWPLAADETVCGVISPDMRSRTTTLTLRKAGLKVTFPEGAVSASTNICLVAHSGVLLTYGFYPHGLQFNREITVQQDLHGTTAFHNSTLASDLVGGYLANGIEKDVDVNGRGSFAQVFKVEGADETGGFTNVTPSTAKFSTNHFSGYALASGRQ